MYLFFAVFDFADDGINISFPDLDGAFSCGSDMHEALYMSKDLLEGWLLLADGDGEEIPVPSSYQKIKSNYPNSLIVPVEVNLDLAREKHYSKPVKKTLTIPSYINSLAIKHEINFSQTLTEALKEKLGVS